MLTVNSSFLAQELRGIHRFGIEISKALKNLTADVKFLSPENALENEYTREINPDFIKSRYNLPIKSLTFWEQTALKEYLKANNNPLLLNFANTGPMFYKNQIITIHDLMFLQNPKWYSKKHYYLYLNLFKHLAEKSLKVVTVSEYSKKDIIKFFNIPANKIEVIPNAVTTDFVKYLNKDYINPYGDYVLAVSSLDPRKNFKSLIIAFNKLKLKDVKLLIVGSDGVIGKQKEFRELINENKNIIFTGYVSDDQLAGLYKNAKLFVFPSYSEGFGIPPLEAMYCGCPTIVSNTSSIPEVCGDATYYINPYDINDISNAIKTVLSDEELKKELIIKGNERVKLFNWQNSAEKYLKIIESL